MVRDKRLFNDMKKPVLERGQQLQVAKQFLIKGINILKHQFVCGVHSIFLFLATFRCHKSDNTEKEPLKKAQNNNIANVAGSV